MVSEQTHDPAALTPGKLLPVFSWQDAGWVPKSVWTIIYLLPLSLIEYRFFGTPATKYGGWVYRI
jgi:hypothetical protein